MLVNKDQSNAHEVRIALDRSDGSQAALSGPISTITFGSEQYMWQSQGASSHPDPDDPPVRRILPAGTASVTLPKASVTVLRGKG
jgi:hypothetical protein